MNLLNFVFNPKQTNLDIFEWFDLFTRDLP